MLCSNELLTLSGNVISGVWGSLCSWSVADTPPKKLPASSPGRFSVALEVGRHTPKVREKRPRDEVGFFFGGGGGGNQAFLWEKWSIKVEHFSGEIKA